MPATPMQAPTDAATSETKTLLVVDDEVDILESLKLIFEGEDPPYRVLTASNGREALDLLGREPVDAVISDWRMPGMDGVSFLRQARQVAPDVPRMLLTAFPRRNVASRAVHDAAILEYLVKPVDPEELVRVVRKAVSGKSSTMDIKRVDHIFSREADTD